MTAGSSSCRPVRQGREGRTRAASSSPVEPEDSGRTDAVRGSPSAIRPRPGVPPLRSSHTRRPSGRRLGCEQLQQPPQVGRPHVLPEGRSLGWSLVARGLEGEPVRAADLFDRGAHVLIQQRHPARAALAEDALPLIDTPPQQVCCDQAVQILKPCIPLRESFELRPVLAVLLHREWIAALAWILGDQDESRRRDAK
jgi:hypothetical protein